MENIGNFRFADRGRRLAEFYDSSPYKTKSEFCRALGIPRPNIDGYFSGERDPKVIVDKLISVGADVEYIITGKRKDDRIAEMERENKESIRIHFKGDVSDALKERTQKLAEWLLRYGQNNTPAKNGYVSQLILSGQEVDAEGNPVS